MRDAEANASFIFGRKGRSASGAGLKENFGTQRILLEASFQNKETPGGAGN